MKAQVEALKKDKELELEACKMLLKGAAVEEVMVVTGLSKEKIEELIN